MPTSDKDLAKLQDSVQKLRDQRDAEAATLVQRQLELQNDVVATALQSEADILQAEIAALKSQNSVTAVKAGAAAVVDPAGTAAAVQDAALQAQVDSGDLPAEAVADNADSTKSKGGNR